MTPADFAAWRLRLRLRKAGAAHELGLAPNTVTAYEAGRTKIPLYVALACAALAHGLSPWGALAFEPASRR